MPWIALACMYIAGLACGCWLIHAGYPSAGGWLIALNFMFSGFTISERKK